VPSRFLTDPDLVAAMVNDHDNRSFNLFLLLWRDYAGLPKGRRSAMTLDYGVYARKLGIEGEKDDEKAEEKYRRAIIKVLRKLEKEYDLITVAFKFGGPATVRMKMRRAGDKEGIAVPAEFWEYGWLRTLGLSEKMLYLVSLVETVESRKKPWWSLSQESIGQKYSIDRWTVNQALDGLERAELLEVRRCPAWRPEGTSFAAPTTTG